MIKKIPARTKPGFFCPQKKARPNPRQVNVGKTAGIRQRKSDRQAIWALLMFQAHKMKLFIVHNTRYLLNLLP
jgi:hypothetical protein